MNPIVLCIGGCRSGKSRYAQELAESLHPDGRCYIATCVPHDAEMKQRVADHQAQRDATWRLVEAPIGLPEAIVGESGRAKVILADCLTLWMTNLMLDPEETGNIGNRLAELESALTVAQCPVILVSNEVGCGIVPENRLAREFRDRAGQMNQRVAAAAHTVVWTVAGIPVFIKGTPPHPD